MYGLEYEYRRVRAPVSAHERRQKSRRRRQWIEALKGLSHERVFALTHGDSVPQNAQERTLVHLAPYAHSRDLF